MGRSRMIKPEFFMHERLASLSPLHRLAFIGMWTLADREGRLEDRPERIKAAILPYDDCNIHSIISDLAEHQDSLILRFVVEGKKVIQIRNFTKHQSPHHKEAPSQLPAMPEDYAPLCDKVEGSCLDLACAIHGASTRTSNKKQVTSNKQQVVFAGEPTFAVFWRDYPNRIDKREAFGLWQKIRLDEVPAVMAGLLAWKRSGRWDDAKFVPSPARWLRRRKWEDDLAAGAVAEPPKHRVNTQCAKCGVVFFRDEGHTCAGEVAA